MVQSLCLKRMRSTVNRTAFRIRRPENQPANARMYHGSSAHQAGLKRHIKCRTGQSIVAGALCRITECDDFRMRRRVAARYRLIPAFAGDLAIDNNHRTDRNFIMLTCMRRQAQCILHPVNIAFVVDYFHSIANRPQQPGFGTDFAAAVKVDTLQNTIFEIAADTCYVNQPEEQTANPDTAEPYCGAESCDDRPTENKRMYGFFG